MGGFFVCGVSYHMPIISSDIKLRLSTTSGAAGNSTSQGDPNASLGKYLSTTDLVDDTLNNLFDNISGDENAALTVDYRCLFIYNSHGSLTYLSPKVWISGRRSTSVGSTDVITSASHGFTDTTMVRVEAEYNTDVIPSGLNDTTTYYVISSTTDTFKLSATLNGSSVDIGDSSGFSVRRYGITTVAIGLDTNAASANGASPAQALTIANELTAPAGVSFSSPTTKAAGLSLSDLVSGNCRAIWIRRTATASAAKDLDGMTVGISGDTGE
jgi:hypothetical protein